VKLTCSSCWGAFLFNLRREQVGIVDAVVSSPPYANAFDYHLYHRHRLYWLGHDPAEVRQREIGSHLNYQRETDPITAYREDMEQCFARTAACLRPGGPCALVVGDSVFHGETVDNRSLLLQAARTAGFSCLAATARAIHPIKRSVIHAARRARTEHILLLVGPR